MDLLNKAIELPMYMYSKLTNPEFVTQTSMEENGSYWVVIESEGSLFKFHLFS